MERLLENYYYENLALIYMVKMDIIQNIIRTLSEDYFKEYYEQQGCALSLLVC